METAITIIGFSIALAVLFFGDYFRHLQMKKLAKKLGLHYSYSASSEGYTFKNFFSSNPIHNIKGKYKNRDVLIFERRWVGWQSECADNLSTSIYVDNQLKETMDRVFTPRTKTIQKHLESYL